jgi:hypothetical protein
MKTIWFIFPPARQQTSSLISSVDSVTDVNGLHGWNNLNKRGNCAASAAHRRLERLVERKPSRANHETGHISASTGKGEKFPRVTQIPQVDDSSDASLNHRIDGLVGCARRAIEEKIETEPKIQKCFPDLATIGLESRFVPKPTTKA